VLRPSLIIVSALLICFASGAAIVILGSRRKALARDRGTKQIEGIAELASQAAFSCGLSLIGAINFSVLATPFPPSLAFPVACALILVLVLGIQLGRLLLRYQLSRLSGELNTVTGQVVAESSREKRLA